MISASYIHECGSKQRMAAQESAHNNQKGRPVKGHLLRSNTQKNFKHEGALYKEVFPGKTEAHLSVTVKVRGSNSKWRAI